MSGSFRFIGHQLWQDNDFLLDYMKIMPPEPPNKVYVVFHVRYFVKLQQKYVMTHFSEVAGVGFLDYHKQQDAMTYFLYQKLTPLNVPKLYLEKILSPAMSDLSEEMQNDPCNANKTWLGMVGAIALFKTQNETAATRRLPPIQAFEKVRVGGEEDLHIIDDLCPICLEETSVGAEFIRLPCSHMYHHLCIAQLLSKSNSCPLCRRPFTALPDSALHILGLPDYALHFLEVPDYFI